ncbi:MAG: sodium:proton antiporter [Clostridia bacterium]|nr:sodium:proton antiporter [Clostridia bacterium]
MILLVLILLPVLGAVLSPLAGRKSGGARELLLRLFTLLELLLSLYTAWRVLRGETVTFALPGMLGLGLSFRADAFRAVYASLACFMWAIACQFSLEYFAGHTANRGRYALFTLLTLCGVVGVFYSDDLYTTFVFFEIMSIASYPWVAHEETSGAMRAAATYLGVSVACGMVTLMGMFLAWKEIGSLSFSALRSAEGSNGMGVAACLMLVGYCAKAGMVPLHIWLPKAHPVAPAPASALLSGMLTKTGLFGVIVIGMNVMGESEVFGHVFLALGLVTMTLGAVLAVFSVNLKRTLACSSLSQIGYITVGLSCAMLLGHHGALAAAGAVGHMVNHSLLKLCLFLCAGAAYMKAHTLDLNELKGFGRGKPLLHIVFLLGAMGLAGVPLLNGYTSKTMIHEGLVELAGEIEGFSVYRLCEWVFLFAAGLTTAYMLKLYICLFWQKNRDAHRQAHYDELSGHSMSARSACVLVLTAVPLIAIGTLPNRVLLPLTRACADFLNRPALSHDVSFFSFGNLKGGGVSLVIGVTVYLFFVRKALHTEKEGYIDRWPKWLDLEELFYRPVFIRFLPWLGCTLASALDHLPDCRLIRVWIPKGASAFFSFLDRLPDSKFVLQWIPKCCTAVFSFLDHLLDSKLVLQWIPKCCTAAFSFLERLPESKFFSRILPGFFVALVRVLDELVDHLMLLGRQLFLVNREELGRAQADNVFTHLARALAEGLHKLGVLPKRFVRQRDASDPSWGNSLTNAISFGLLLCTAGLVGAILYVFIRLGAQ